MVNWHPEAREELDQAIGHYHQIVSDLGADFAMQMKMILSAIAEDPLRPRVRKYGTRRFNLKRFPYYIAYFIWNDTVWIVAVAHERRKPFYWKERLSGVA